MLSIIGAGGHTPFPQTLIFHLQAATRHLAKALAVPSTRAISGVSRSCHGTSLSPIPWAATSNHSLALQLASISRNVSGSSLSMSTLACHTWYFVYVPHKPCQFSAGSPMTPRYRVGNVLFHCSPCRCVGRCLPTRCTIHTPLAALDDFLHAGLLCRQPK